MNYWIFVHTGKGKEAERNFSRLLKSKCWGFGSSPQIKQKILQLKPGDYVVFYVGGINNKYFAGEARLMSEAHDPTRDSIGGPTDDLTFMVDFENFNPWEKLYLKKGVRDQLSFIKNKDNWGMSFGQSLIKISDSDYKEIKSLIK